MRTLSIIAWLLVIIGAINWGLVGAFGFNIVSAISGSHANLARIIYVLVGLAGLYSIGLFSLISREWEEKRPEAGYRAPASAPPTPTSTTPTAPTV